jgi:hypothetical protein
MISTLIDFTEPISGAPNFSWRELTITEHRGLIEENRRVPVAFQPAGTALAQMAQKVRDHFQSPVITHSAYRGEVLNTTIGGSKTSQHMRFEAIDFHVVGSSLRTVFDWIRKGSGIAFGQLILEGPDPAAGDASWIHLSLGHPYRAAERCGQVLFYSTRTRKYTQA